MPPDLQLRLSEPRRRDGHPILSAKHFQPFPPCLLEHSEQEEEARAHIVWEQGHFQVLGFLLSLFA